MRTAAIGECMVEFYRRPDGLYVRTFGGDTLNATVYLARLGVPIDYVTALGDDSYSDDMIAGWQDEGIGTALVVRLPGRVPGLYVIDTDARGERSFHYWRSATPARELLDLPQTADLAERLTGYDLVYLSGITLSLYDEPGRARLFALLDGVRGRGGRVVFDGNYRPRGWPDPAEARRAFTAMLERTDIALPTFDDEAQLFDDGDPEATVRRLRASGVGEIVVKRGPEPCLAATPAGQAWVPVERTVEPVDTTAAGDSFNSGYLAGRLRGRDPVTAARLGHRLANQVIRHRGAIIPKAAMPAVDDILPSGLPEQGGPS